MFNYSCDPGLSICCRGSEKSKDPRELWHGHIGHRDGQPGTGRKGWSWQLGEGAVEVAGRLNLVKAGIVALG